MAESPAVAHQAQRTWGGEVNPLQRSNHRVCRLCNVICNDGIPFVHTMRVLSVLRIFCPW